MGDVTFWEFIASIVDSLAWPGAILASAFIFRGSIVRLLPTLRHLRFKDLELDFERALEEVEAEAEALPLPEGVPTLPDGRRASPQFQFLVAKSPKLAVVDSWFEIEQALVGLGKKVGIDARLRGGRLEEELVRRKAMGSDTARVLNDLRRLRNIAIHEVDHGITTEEAWRYRGLADQVLLALQRADLDISNNLAE